MPVLINCIIFPTTATDGASADTADMVFITDRSISIAATLLRERIIAGQTITTDLAR
jgi:hypothetical protein